MSSSALRQALDQHAATVAVARVSVEDGAHPAPVKAALVEIFDAARDALAAPGAGSGLRLRRCPSVTQLLQTFHFREPPGRFVDEAALARGRAIHLACQYDDEGTLDEESVHPSVKPFLEQFRRFRREIGTTRSIAWEREHTHTRFGYKGRWDNYRWVKGRRGVLDIKTNDADAATAVQLALYDHLITDDLGEAPQEWHALVLRPKTYRWKRVEPAEMAQHRADALALVRTYHALARQLGTAD